MYAAWNYPDSDVLKDYFNNYACSLPSIESIILSRQIEFKIDFIKNTVEKFKAKIKIYDHHKSHFFSKNTFWLF